MDSGNKKVAKVGEVEIDKVSYYNKGKFETFDVIDDLAEANPNYTGSMMFYLGNALKYIWRAGMKKGASMEADLTKAVYYLNKVLDLVKQKNKKKQ